MPQIPVVSDNLLVNENTERKLEKQNSEFLGLTRFQKLWKLQDFRESESEFCTSNSKYPPCLENRAVPSSFNAILTKNYSKELNGLDKPYFPKCNNSGLKHSKVFLSRVTAMSEETQEGTPEFVQYIKERDAALEDVKKAQADLRETQSKLYDAILLIEDLEKKVKEYETNEKSSKGTGGKKAGAGPRRKSMAQTKTSTLGVKGNDVKGSTLSLQADAKDSRGGANSARSSPAPMVYHPPIPSQEPCADSREYYWKLAEKFPTLPMFQVLDAEKKFIKADIDKNGSIDKNELDKVLMDTVGMFTQKQVDEIFQEVDQDHNETLDFYEVLFVLNKLFTRRRTNLPQSVQQNYTKTCSIQ